VLRPDDARPFLFQPGDRVRFTRQSRADFDAERT
jgi:allophanate hydrolase subunit 1